MLGLSVLVPVHNHDVTALVRALVGQLPQWPGPAEVVVLDDGSTHDCRHQNRPLGLLPGVRYAELPHNVGRAAARNQLVASAQYEWLLLLDATTELLPPGQLLATYAKALGPAPVLAGGVMYGAAPPLALSHYLRWQYGRVREWRPVAARQAAPHAQFLVNNLLIKKEILAQFGFDESLRGYGHEDTKLGWQLAAAGIPVRHLDNPVLHAQLTENKVFVANSVQAVRNLAYLLRTKGLGVDTRLVKSALWLRRWRLVPVARLALGVLAPGLRRQLLTKWPQLWALDLLKLYCLLGERW